MTFWNRLRFFIGILVVFIIVGLLVLYLNNALSTVTATQAELSADTTTVGIDYPGLITNQYVTEGDKVSKNQTLFEVSSSQLVADINSRSVKTATLPFKIDPKTNAILVKANTDGVVEKVNYRAGSYVPGGSVIATVDTFNTLFISGNFNLSPPDYTRVKKGNTMDITFPDNSKFKATVYNISLVKDGETVDTVVKARLNNANVTDFKFPIGTPVDASLKLTQRTWYQNITDFVNKIFKPQAN